MFQIFLIILFCKITLAYLSNLHILLLVLTIFFTYTVFAIGQSTYKRPLGSRFFDFDRLWCFLCYVSESKFRVRLVIPNQQHHIQVLCLNFWGLTTF